ncbi:MAG TPA: EAL domain-containing protein [Xanthobacteraceae bacterium]|nr:EAL domain-containing protein [Xanthobacteraceae bacterium]
MNGPRSCNCGIFHSSKSRSSPNWWLVARTIARSGRYVGISSVAANQFGARTVAVGIENYADFFTARELGFDLVQGFLFAKPMGAQTFMRAIGPDLTNTV